MSAVKAGIFILWGQSNRLGVQTGSVPAGIPSAAIRYNYWNYSGNDFTALEDLQADPLVPGAHGGELQFGLDIHALGAFDVVVICKVAKGATTISDWRPGGPEGLCDVLIRKSQECRDWIDAAHPGCEKRYFMSSFIGETDAANATPPTLWAENFLLTRQAVETALGVQFRPVVVRTNANQIPNTNLPIVRSEQADAATGGLVSTDSLPLLGDNIHFSPSTLNTIGSLEAAAMTRVIYMAVTHPTAVRNEMGDLVVDGVDVSGPGKIILRAGATVLATITLANPAFSATSGGVATLLGVPLPFVGSADGSADNYLCQDGASSTRFQGSVTATGGGGDLTLASVAIVNGGTGSITGGSYTAPP